MKLILAAVVLGLLLPFTLLKDEQGKTLMSFSSFSLPDFKMPGMPSGKQILPDIDGHRRQDIVYRWNDSKGNIHFTTEPPADGIQFTVKGYDPGANVIRAVEFADSDAPIESIAADTSVAHEQNSSPDLQKVYDKDSILNLFDDSSNIQQVLNQRLDKQNSAVNQ
ncbi:MAG: DUF4124 domain-containing protein [Gammaproteobacteria bacterium]|jgi:hypothetical protein|nr:DUF4124 domain-containing protein [Gammaproteobacteria bacterium]